MDVSPQFEPSDLASGSYPSTADFVPDLPMQQRVMRAARRGVESRTHRLPSLTQSVVDQARCGRGAA